MGGVIFAAMRNSPTLTVALQVDLILADHMVSMLRTLE